ncbi:MAG: glycosyltransferase family 39 protein [Gemmataceae bacterium]|nr:glycosyltransferase family 39 protein [Gemmataceae bacterium]
MTALACLFDVRRPVGLLFLALVYTLFNAVKPLTIDDGAYYYYARQIAQAPLEPYDFQIFWYQWPQPANDVLAPPLVPYWWAIAYRIAGEQPLVWKLWLFPFAFLFVWAISRLTRRFAPGLESSLAWMTILSPAFLPSFNLMLDVPALALGLGAVETFCRAWDRLSLSRALLAGTLAGLAMQTKYTGFLAPAVILLYWVVVGARPFRGRAFWLGPVAAVVAVALFGAWEGYVALRCGESHFLCSLRQQPAALSDKLGLAMPLLTILGGLGLPLILLGLTALWARWKLVLPVAALLIGGHVAVVLLPPVLPVPTPLRVLTSDRPSFSTVFWLYAAYGSLLSATTLLILWRLAVPVRSKQPVAPGLPVRLDRFLILWLLLEVSGYFVLTPFPAARRVLGILVVVTLVAGRLAARMPLQPVLLRGVTCVGVLLGLLVFSVDLLDARACRDSVNHVAGIIREQDHDQPIWYVGHWGFQYYAERAGLRPVVPDRSALRVGDWLVKPDGVNQQLIEIDGTRAETQSEVSIEDKLPWRTVMGFYRGTTPLERLQGPRARVTIYRVTADWVPRTPEWKRILAEARRP